jgi:hypothetical protein
LRFIHSHGLEIHEVWYSDRLQIIVVPSHPRIYDLPTAGIGSAPWQGTFPPPGRVRDHYASALSGAKEGGFDDILVSKQKGEENKPYKPYNLISACVAWYLQDKDNKVVDECLSTLPDASPIKTRRTWPRDLEKLSPSIRDIDDALQKVNYNNLVQGFWEATEM